MKPSAKFIAFHCLPTSLGSVDGVFLRLISEGYEEHGIGDASVVLGIAGGDLSGDTERFLFRDVFDLHRLRICVFRGFLKMKHKRNTIKTHIHHILIFSVIRFYYATFFQSNDLSFLLISKHKI